MGLKNETIVAEVLILLGVICLVVGLATPAWIHGLTQNMGLWKQCVADTGICTAVSWSDSDTFTIVRVLIIISLVASIGALVCATIYLINEQQRISTYKNVSTACLACSVASLVSALIGCGIFTFYDESGLGSVWEISTLHFGYSFFLTIIGGVLVVIGAALRFAKK